MHIKVANVTFISSNTNRPEQVFKLCKKKMTQSINTIVQVVKSNRLVSQRVEKLRNIGFNVQEFAMGSGGILQEKKMADGSIRIQIGYGHGRHNYAMTVVL